MNRLPFSVGKTALLKLIMALLVSVSLTIAVAETLYYGLSFGDLGSLDPHMSTATQDVIINATMYNALVRYPTGDLDTEALEPDLAQSWEVSDDGLTYTFHLREGVQFQHGYGELTAEDVVFSLEKAATSATSAFAGRYDAYDSFVAEDDYTVVITLKHGVPFPLGPLANIHGGLIISKAAYEEMGADDFRNHGVGTGPFQFRSYDPSSRVVVERHEGYFRGAAKLDRVEFQFMPDLRSRQLAFEAGELDIIQGEAQQWWIDEMRAKPGIIVEPINPGEMATLHINMSIAPLDDVNVRRAIAHAINKEELQEFMGVDVAAPAPSIVPPGALGFTDEVASYEYDLEKTSELLAAAGFPEGIDLGDVVVSEIASQRLPFEVVHDQLQRAGIKFNMQVVDHPTYHERIRENLSPLVWYSAVRVPVADPYLREWFSSEAIVGKPTAITNFSHYDKIDDYMDRAALETDLDVQLELWHEAQKLAMQDLPAYPLVMNKTVGARRDTTELGYVLDSNLVNGYEITELTDVTR